MSTWRAVEHLLKVSKSGSRMSACGVRKPEMATSSKRGVTCIRCLRTFHSKKLRKEAR